MVDVATMKLTAMVAAPVMAGAAATEVFAEEHIRFLAALVAVVAIVVGVVTWIRMEIKSEIKSHTDDDKLRHRAVLAEIKHLREVLAVKLNAPELRETNGD